MYIANILTSIYKVSDLIFFLGKNKRSQHNVIGRIDDILQSR